MKELIIALVCLAFVAQINADCIYDDDGNGKAKVKSPWSGSDTHWTCVDCGQSEGWKFLRDACEEQCGGCVYTGKKYPSGDRRGPKSGRGKTTQNNQLDVTDLFSG